MPEESEPEIRKIIHVDMDAFYASVEQRDNPALRGKPVAVGGSARRGVVAAASYEARQFGVRSAMPSVTASRRCPELLFVPARFDVYRTVSDQIRDIFARYTHLIEPLSLDEAYLDVTADQCAIGSATQTAQQIRKDILEATGLTASAGISYNKFLAKIASDQNKPNGQCVITPAHGEEFVAGLPVRRFHGVGPKTAERMARLGIRLGVDLRARDPAFLQQHFGASAEYLYRAARGIDHRPVRPHRQRKSVGRERTYSSDLEQEAELHHALNDIIDSVWQRIEKNRVIGRTVTLKVKYADFKQITRSKSGMLYVNDKNIFAAYANELLEQVLPPALGVRLLGLSLSNLAAAKDSSTTSTTRVGEATQGSFDF